MKAAEVREKTTEELETLESELTRELWKSRFENHTNQLDDTDKLRRLRRDIARVKTIVAQRKSAEETKAAAENG